MRRIRRFAFVIAAVAALTAITAGGAAAQEAEAVGYLAAVNGASTDPVDVTAGTEPIAPGLAYAADGVPAIVPAGSYNVVFAGGSVDSAVAVEVAASTAQTVVSGYGVDPATAAAYPIDTTPIEAGMAKVTVWNATGATVSVTVDDQAPVEVQPGTGIPSMTVAADTTVSVTIDGVQKDIATPSDSYSDVFAVNDTQQPQIAVSVIPSMTELLATIAPSDDTVPVPDVTGQPAADAQAAIEAVGLVAAPGESSSDTVEAGLVIETDPPAGTPVDLGSTVTMIVSTGPDAPTTVPVPDVVGQTAADAQAALEAEGFAVTSTEQASADVEEGLVISTNPAAGTEVAPGTTVDMTVSTGPEDVEVPDFAGLSVDEATALAEEVGLTITFVEDPDDPDPEGIVVDQDPDAGELVAAGSEVVAQLSPAIAEAWVILTLDPNQILTATGINFLPGSTVDMTVVGTNLSSSAIVDAEGQWVARTDLSDVANEAEQLLVRGTAADGSEYEQTFVIPATGESTDEVMIVAIQEEPDDGGIPWWGWVLGALLLAGVAALIWWLVAGRDQASGAGGSPGEGSGG